MYAQHHEYNLGTQNTGVYSLWSKLDSDLNRKEYEVYLDYKSWKCGLIKNAEGIIQELNTEWPTIYQIIVVLYVMFCTSSAEEMHPIYLKSKERNRFCAKYALATSRRPYSTTLIALLPSFLYLCLCRDVSVSSRDATAGKSRSDSGYPQAWRHMHQRTVYSASHAK